MTFITRIIARLSVQVHVMKQRTRCDLQYFYYTVSQKSSYLQTFYNFVKS